VVECTALEMRHTGNRIGGSNPSLSATLIKSMAYADLLATLAAVISDRYPRNDLLHHAAVTKDKALGHDKPPRLFVVRRAGASMSAVDSVRRDAAFMTLLDPGCVKTRSVCLWAA
jgi:hypothetical protein